MRRQIGLTFLLVTLIQMPILAEPAYCVESREAGVTEAAEGHTGRPWFLIGLASGAAFMFPSLVAIPVSAVVPVDVPVDVDRSLYQVECYVAGYDGRVRYKRFWATTGGAAVGVVAFMFVAITAMYGGM